MTMIFGQNKKIYYRIFLYHRLKLNLWYTFAKQTGFQINLKKQIFR